MLVMKTKHKQKVRETNILERSRDVDDGTNGEFFEKLASSFDLWCTVCLFFPDQHAEIRNGARKKSSLRGTRTVLPVCRTAEHALEAHPLRDNDVTARIDETNASVRSGESPRRRKKALYLRTHCAEGTAKR